MIEIQTIGCYDCPLLRHHEECFCYCGHPIKNLIPATDKDVGERQSVVVTPDWCPLLEGKLTVELVKIHYKGVDMG